MKKNKTLVSCILILILISTIFPFRVNAATIQDFPAYHRKQFLENLKNCIPYRYDFSIKYNLSKDDNYKDDYNSVSSYSYVIDGRADNGKCTLYYSENSSLKNPPANGCEMAVYSLPKYLLNQITEENFDKLIGKYYSSPFVSADITEKDIIPEWFTKEEKAKAKEIWEKEGLDGVTKYIIETVDKRWK